MADNSRPKASVVVISTSSARDDRPTRGRYKPKHPFLAGAVTGGIEILITYPLEYTKCQLQLHQEAGTAGASAGPPRPGHLSHPESNPAQRRNGSLQNPKRLISTASKPSRFLSSVPCAPPTSIWGIVKETVQLRGFIGLYSGLSSWLVFSFPRAALRFTTYETCLSAYERWQYGSKLKHSPAPPTLLAFMAGTVAGAVEAATCMTPMHCIQIKMQQDAEKPSPRFRGFLHASASIVKEEGLQKGLLAGMGPTVVKAAINNCIRFGLMSELSSWRRRHLDQDDAAALSAIDTLSLGGAAGALSAVATHPIDTIKSNLQGNAQHKAQFGGSSIGCLRWIFATAGPRGLFHGLSARIVRVTMEVSLHFTLFDILSRSLDTLL